MKSTLGHEHAIKLLITKVNIFSDSVLCLGGRIADYPQTVKSWTDKIEWSTDSALYRGCTGLTENQSCSSGRFSQGTHNTAVAPGNPHDDGGKPNCESQRKRTPSTQRNKCVVPRSFEKQRRWNNIDTLQRGSSDGRVVFRIIISVNQLSIYGAVADWCEELAQQISDHSSLSTGHLVAKVKDDSESKGAPTVVSILTKAHLINVPARGNSVQQYRKIRKPSRRHPSEYS